MTVAELIAQLSQLDPRLRVLSQPLCRDGLSDTDELRPVLGFRLEDGGAGTVAILHLGESEF